MSSRRLADQQGFLDPKRPRNIENTRPDQARPNQTRPRIPTVVPGMSVTSLSQERMWEKRRPSADVGGLGTPRGDPDTAQDASQVGPRRLHIPFGRPSETVGDLSTPGLVTTAGVSVTVAPDTAGPGNRYRGSRQGMPQTPRGWVTDTRGLGKGSPRHRGAW